MSTNISILEDRKHNLQEIIDSSGFKSLTSFAKNYGLFASNLSMLLNGTREFSDRIAKNLEEKLKIPRGSLSKPRSSALQHYIFRNFIILTDNKMHQLLKEDNSLFSIDKDKIDHFDNNKIISIPPNSGLNREPLLGTISNDSFLLINTSETSLLDDKIYLINSDSKILIRKYLNNKFISNDPKYYADFDKEDSIEIIGRLIYEITAVKKH